MAIQSTLPVQYSPTSSKPIRLCFDASARPFLGKFLPAHPSLFVEAHADAADLVVFGTDEIGYVRHSSLYRNYRRKSICITETDIPTFFLPGLYAANDDAWFTGSRTRTMSYFLSMVERPNLAVRDLIGKAVEKRYLYSFMGGTNSWARRRLLLNVKQREDTLIEPTDAYNHWQPSHRPEEKQKRREHYAEVMAASKYVLCPRGCGSSSYRLFESMSLGVTPVVLSDHWRPVEGIGWSFALFIPEKRIPQLDEIVRDHAHEWKQRGKIASQTYQEHFAPAVVAFTLYKQLGELIGVAERRRELAVGYAMRLRAGVRQSYWDCYGIVKRIALAASRHTGIGVPIPMHRPGEEQLK